MTNKGISDKTLFLSNEICRLLTHDMFNDCSYDDCIRIVLQSAIASVQLLDNAKQMEIMK